MTPDKMTLRDWFAGQALIGFIGKSQTQPTQFAYVDYLIAQAAYRAADEMMSERAKARDGEEQNQKDG